MARATPSRRNLFGWLRKKETTYRRSRGESSHTSQAYRAGVKSGDTGAFDSWLRGKRLDNAPRSIQARLESAYRRGVERAGVAERIAAKKAERSAKKKPAALSSYKGFRLYKLAGGEYTTSIDKESHFDSLQDAKDFIRDWKRDNPCARTLKANVSDRAKRYRANQPGCLPNYPKKCKLCGSRSDVMVDHVDGNESNGRKSNLRWLCRSCNNTLAAEMVKAGQGRRTVQYNPAHKGAQTLGEYMQAVLQHTRGAHDAGGKIIHDTPKSKRREFASEIWSRREAHGTARPGSSRASGYEPDWVTNPEKVPASELHRFSEQSMIALMKHDRITYAEFIDEIRRRVAAGERVHPYHRDLAKNPASSAAQYRLAQAVLSGTARTKTRMSRAAAQEIVDSTPAHLRSEYMRAENPLDDPTGEREATKKLWNKTQMAARPIVFRAATQHWAVPMFKLKWDQLNYDAQDSLIEAVRDRLGLGRGPASNPYYSLAIFDGVSRLGGKQEFSAPHLQAAQEKTQEYADDMGYDAVLYDVSGKSLGRFQSNRPIYEGRRHEERRPNPLPSLAPRYGQRQPKLMVRLTDAGVPYGSWIERADRRVPGAVFDEAEAQAGDFGQISVGRKIYLWRRNPELDLEGDGSEQYRQAKRIAELFHGRPVKEHITVTENITTPDWYVALGPLVELRVKGFRGAPFRTARFPFGKLKGDDTIQFFTSADGKQFYFRGGDQEINLEALGMGPDSEWFRDSMLLGDVTYFAYRDGKKFHNFQTTDYYHKVGSALDWTGTKHIQKTKVKPVLIYDTLSKKISLAGGLGKVETDTLVENMSPGIVN